MCVYLWGSGGEGRWCLYGDELFFFVLIIGFVCMVMMIVVYGGSLCVVFLMMLFWLSVCDDFC